MNEGETPRFSLFNALVSVRIGDAGRAPEGIDIEAQALRNLLAETTRHAVMVMVVVCPLLALWWRLGERLGLDQLTLALQVAVAGLLVACEQWLAFKRSWGSAVRGNLTDFIYVGLGMLMDKAAFVVGVTVVAAAGRSLAAGLQIELWPGDWSFGFQLLLALVIADVGTYIRHRLSHSSDILWRFHQVHHSAGALYWIRSAYTHPVEQALIMIAIMFPIALMGAGPEIIAATAFLFGLSGLVQHANIDSRSSFLNYVLATAETHRLHHRADEVGNRSNFSAFFVWLDLLFGTYRYPSPSEDPESVGLEGVTDFPGDFLSHLVIPFQRNRFASGSGDEWARNEGRIS